MMNTGDAILADIREHPDDAALRRIYADWLDDHGDAARAEFIRVQLDLAALGEWDDARPALEKRQAQLLREHEQQWLTGLPRKGLEYRFAGGFAEEVSGSAFRVLGNLATIGRQVPVRRMTLRRDLPARDHRPVEALAVLDRIESLAFSNTGPSASDWSALLEDCAFSRLRNLELILERDPISILGRLAQHPIASRLACLSLHVGSDEFWTLAPLQAWPEANPLRSFHLHATNSTPESMLESLGKLPLLARLRELNLWLDLPTNSVLDALRSAPSVPHLQRLTIITLTNDDLVGQLLADLPLDSLRHLHLDANVADGETLGRLCRTPWFERLETLELWSTPQFELDRFVHKGLPAPRLIRCVLSLPPDEPAIRTLAAWGTWPSVRSLGILGVCTGDQLRLFLDGAPLDNLRDLRVGRTFPEEVGDRIAKWPGLSHLWRLNVSSSGLTDIGARALLNALPPLVELNLEGNRLSADTVAAFRDLEASGHIGTLYIDEAKS